jgi:hypothetical protein
MLSMITVWIVVRAAYELAWKFGLIMISVALLASMSRGNRDASYESAVGVSIGSQSSAEDATYVTMKRSGELGRSSCLLRDEDGSELLSVRYDRLGCLHLSWGEGFAGGPSVAAVRDGGLSLNIKANDLLYTLSRQPDGATGFELFDLSDGTRRCFRITEEGEVVRVPAETAR